MYALRIWVHTQLAETRLKGLQRRLNRDNTLKKDYSAYMQSLVDKGYAKQVDHAGAEVFATPVVYESILMSKDGDQVSMVNKK